LARDLDRARELFDSTPTGIIRLSIHDRDAILRVLTQAADFLHEMRTESAAARKNVLR
jgi:hypothetical protein